MASPSAVPNPSPNPSPSRPGAVGSAQAAGPGLVPSAVLLAAVLARPLTEPTLDPHPAPPALRRGLPAALRPAIDPHHAPANATPPLATPFLPTPSHGETAQSQRQSQHQSRSRSRALSLVTALGLGPAFRPQRARRTAAFLARARRDPSAWCWLALVWAVAAFADSITTWIGLRLGGQERNVAAATLMRWAGVEVVLVGGLVLSLACGIACCVPRRHPLGQLRGGVALVGVIKLIVCFSNLATIIALS